MISHLYQKENGSWVIQTNKEHCEGVAKMAASFASEFGMEHLGHVLGLMHDRGKEKTDFQKHIKRESGYDANVRPTGDTSHSLTGAIVLNRKYPDKMCLLSNPIAGHHRGLYDIDELEYLLTSEIDSEIDRSVPDIKLSKPDFDMKGSDIHHLSRMLYSCLVDADYLDTERFMNKSSFDQRGGCDAMPTLLQRLNKHLEKLSQRAQSPLNILRSKVQQQCADKALCQPGFFELTVPTGGGKTIASMVWAINHAIRHRKKRVIIAIPYTSIIIQTAQTLREIFGDENVLEHHSIIADDKISDKNRLATENWDFPIVVTTNVQLFESMFSNRPGKCRKLHSLANSIVILDEVQSLPLSFLQPIIDGIKAYAKMFGTSFLFCTASQPILDGDRKGEGQAIFKGLENNSICRIVNNPLRLHESLRRVKINFASCNRSPEDIARQLKNHNRVLCVANTRKTAAEIFDCMPNEGITLHLSRMMCPMHIRETIKKIKQALKQDNDTPVRVVSTQLIEAGVDIDFPVVYRQFSGLDSILQAAGRCNREGLLPEATTYVYQTDGYTPHGSIANATNAMKEMRSLYPDSDWLAPETMHEYYRILYTKTPTFDKENITAMSANAKHVEYESIAKKFRLIDDTGVPLIVNYGNVQNLIDQLKIFGPSNRLSKQLGQYTVNVNRRLFNDMMDSGLIEEPWEGIYYVGYADQYDPKKGLKSNNEYLEQTYTI